MLNEDAAVHLPAPASCALVIDGGVIVGTSDGELLRYSLSDDGEFALQAQTTLWRGVEVDGIQTISTTKVLVCCGGRLAVHGASALDRAATLCATCTGAFCRQTAAGASRIDEALALPVATIAFFLSQENASLEVSARRARKQTCAAQSHLRALGLRSI